MNTADLLRRLRRAERRRRALIVVALLLPWTPVVAVLARRWRDDAAWLSPGSLMSLLVLVAIGLLWAWRRASAVDDAWLSRRLDDQRRDLDDSAALLFQSQATLPALSRLQQARLQQRLQAVPLPDLRTPWPLRPLVVSALLALAVIAAIMLWNARIPRVAPGSDSSRRESAGDQAIRIISQRLEVQAPAYTGLAMQRYEQLQAKVPEGSILRWTLRFAPQPDAAALLFHDGSRLPLQRRGAEWVGSRQIDKATYFRLQLQSARPLSVARRHRIDVIVDQPPQIRVSEPDRTLVVLERKRAQWPLAFEASDDFGLGAAQLRITLAQGSGENISVSARTLTLPGQGTARRRSYRHRIDLAALGFAVGDDLVVRLSVSDKRVPSRQTTRSASFILRWPANAGAEATGVEGLLNRALPAYFRSQRQVIIDSEALLAQRHKLAADKYLKQSDEIGVDQRILRLRYGEFLGQETSEAPTLPASTPATAGDTASVLEAFGHGHDQPEAATLLDPETRALLKSALDQMWQAELHLRQGNVQLALPFEYRALRFIKQVQQAGRIYLARVGVELPPIDESRRLSGDRAGLQARRDALTAARIEASPALALWQALDADQGRSANVELDVFERWLRARESSLPDALDLFAAVEALRREPDCVACAIKLRSLLWPLLPMRAPAVDGRRVPDRSERTYLELLKRESES